MLVCMCVYVYMCIAYVHAHMHAHVNECNSGPPNKGHFGDIIESADLIVLCREVFFFGTFKMYCRNYTGTVSH